MLRPEAEGMWANLDWRLDERAHPEPEHVSDQYVAGYDGKAGVDPAPDVDLLDLRGVRMPEAMRTGA